MNTPDASWVLITGASSGFGEEFVRVEPMVTPKQSLTGDNTERVDTRVLKMIYHVAGSDQALYVGQQLDVFLNAGQDTAGSDIAQNVLSP